MSTLRMTLRTTSPTKHLKNKSITITTTQMEQNQDQQSYFCESQLFGSQTQPQLWIETEAEFKDQLSNYVLSSQTQGVDKSKFVQQKDLLLELQYILNGRLVKNQFDPIDDELPLSMHQQFHQRPYSGLRYDQNKSQYDKITISSIMNKDIQSMSDTELYLWIFDKTCEYLSSTDSNLSTILQKLKNFFLAKILIQPSETRAYKEATEILDQKTQQLTELCDQLQAKILKSEQVIKDQQRKITQLQCDIQDESLSKEIITRQLDVLQRDIKSKQNQYRLLQKDYEHLSLSMQDTLDRCQKLTKTSAQLKHALEKANERYMQAEQINQKAFQNNLDLDKQNQYLLNKNDKYLQNIKQLQKQIEDMKLQMTVDKLKNTTKLQEMRNSQLYLSIKTDDLGQQAQKAIKLIKILAQQGETLLSQHGVELSDLQAFAHFINNIKYSTTAERLAGALYQDRIGNMETKAVQTDYTLLLPYNSIKNNESVTSMLSATGKSSVEVPSAATATGNSITIVKQVMAGKCMAPEQSFISVAQGNEKAVQASFPGALPCASQADAKLSGPPSEALSGLSPRESVVSAWQSGNAAKTAETDQVNQKLYDVIQARLRELRDGGTARPEAEILAELTELLEKRRKRGKGGRKEGWESLEGQESLVEALLSQNSTQRVTRRPGRPRKAVKPGKTLNEGPVGISGTQWPREDPIWTSRASFASPGTSGAPTSPDAPNNTAAEASASTKAPLRALPRIAGRSSTPELLEIAEDEAESEVEVDNEVEIGVDSEMEEEVETGVPVNTPKTGVIPVALKAPKPLETAESAETLRRIAEILKNNQQLTIPQKLALKRLLGHPEAFLTKRSRPQTASALQDDSLSGGPGQELESFGENFVKFVGPGALYGPFERNSVPTEASQRLSGPRRDSFALSDLSRDIAEAQAELTEAQNFLQEKRNDLERLQKVQSERMQNEEINKEEEEALKTPQNIDLDQKILINKAELEIQSGKDLNALVAAKVERFFQKQKENQFETSKVEKTTIFGPQTVYTAMGSKLESLDQLEATINDFDNQKATDQEWARLSHSVNLRNKFARLVGGETTTALQQSQLKHLQEEALKSAQEFAETSTINSISLDGAVTQASSELAALIRSINQIQSNPYNQEVFNTESERYVFDFDQYFDQNIIEQIYDDKIYQKSVEEKMAYIFPQQQQILLPIVIKTISAQEINSQVVQKRTKQQFEKIQQQLTNSDNIQNIQNEVEIIDGLVPNIAQSIQYVHCKINQTYLRDFNKLLGLELQIVQINDISYIQFNKLFPVMRTFQWLQKTMKQIITDRLSMSCSIVVRMPQIDDWDILVQQELQVNNKADKYQIISGTINYWQAIDLTNYIQWWVQQRYGSGPRSTQLVLQIFVCLIMYKHADYEIFLYHQLFTRALSQDYFLLYLQAKTVYPSQKIISHDDIQAVTAALLPNMTAERRRAINLQLMSKQQITFQNLIEVVFTHYTVLRKLHFGHCKQIMSSLTSQEVIQASHFQEFIELSGLQLSRDQTAAFFRCYQKGGQMRNQDFLRFFVDSQAGKFARESRHALNGVMDTKVRNSINVLTRMQDRFAQCLAIVQKRMLGTFKNMKKDQGNQKALYQIELLEKRGQAASLHNQVVLEALNEFDVYQAATSQQNAVLATVSLMNAAHGGVTLMFIDRMVDALRELLNLEEE